MAEPAVDRLSPRGYLTENGIETADRIAADIMLEVSRANMDRAANAARILDGSPTDTTEAYVMMTSPPAAISR